LVIEILSFQFYLDQVYTSNVIVLYSLHMYNLYQGPNINII